ncbi:MAG: adenylate cyclase [Micavibrio aeruginosavorus]|uniref:Adenylate cyclase n=1 Tax=Micavibrio aeruginosavorus TaxID=349221 RepID=A0A2W5BRZ4_9BACT|nr:MAG: adenylate cyclase [Micavibrio aeruginosavorus]
MAMEIEYRFLLAAMPDLGDVKPTPIVQGYLSTDPDRTVRVRRIGDLAKLTVKGRKVGAAAPEFEYEIPVDDAEGMLALCGADDTISKDRYQWRGEDGLVWEIDRFKGRHEGLYVAELEVPALDTPFLKPAWLKAVDITTDMRFANAALTGIMRAELLSNIADVLKKPGL